MRCARRRRRAGRLHHRCASCARRTARGPAREGTPPALPHRRIAAAGQRRAVRKAGRARGGREDRHAEVRHRVRAAGPRLLQLRRLLRRLGPDQGLGLAGAPLGARRAAVPQRRQGRARWPSKARRCARSISTTRAPRCRPCSTTVPAARGGRASSSMPAAATRCWPTSSSARRRTPTTTAPRSSGTSAMPGGSRASAKATSASAGSSTAGSGSSRWPTARPASAPSAGPTT